MMQIRKKDKIFVGVLLPVLLIWGYFHFLSFPQADRLRALKAEQQLLPDEATFPTLKRQLEARVKDAEAACAQEKAEKAPENAVTGAPDALAATRQDAVLAAFTKAGVKVIRVQPLAGETAADDRRGEAVLRATGRCAAPEARQFVVEADYATMTSALGALAATRAAVIPESVSLRVGSRTCRWEVVLWL